MSNESTAANIVPIEDGFRIQALKRTPLGTGLGAISKHSESPTGIPEDISFRTTATGKQFSLWTPSPAKLSQADLYPVRQAFSPHHIAALRLLKVARGRARRALVAMSEGDQVGADSETQKIQVLLPELFCCRSLGDGFGTVIAAILSAFEGSDGDALNSHQLTALLNTFSVLYDRPFLNTTEADEQVEQLETVGLNPYPRELTEFLSSDDSIR